MRRSADGQRSADSCFLLFFLFFSCFVQFFPVCPAHQPAAVAGSDSGFWTLIEPAGPSELPFGDTSGPVPPVHSACLLLGSVFDLCPLFITRPPSFPLICPSSCLYSLTSVLQIWTQRGSGSQQLPVSQKIPLFPPTRVSSAPPSRSSTPLWDIPSLCCGTFLTEESSSDSPESEDQEPGRDHPPASPQTAEQEVSGCSSSSWTPRPS